VQWKKHVENAKKLSLFVTKKRKNIQKHYITIRYPEKSGHCGSPRNKKSENMRTTRLRQKIKKFLDERGEANTTEILEHVNSTMRHGTTPQQLGNVLSKDKDILKVATTKRGGALSGRYEICVWQVRPGALEEKA
jgi:hypothetical protein|tara:strand:- start:302 stop:706 length:405 start_codon:yes stop_codon:yes gene_type:complete